MVAPKRRGAAATEEPILQGRSGDAAAATTAETALEPSSSGRSAAGKACRVNGSAQHHAAGDAAKQQATRRSWGLAQGPPLAVLLLAVLLGLAARQWPPDGLAPKLFREANSTPTPANPEPLDSSSSSSGSISTAAKPAGAGCPPPPTVATDDDGSGGSSGGGSDGGSTDMDEWVVADARGFFPKGCKWREVYRKVQEPKFWDIRQYQYWDEQQGSWTDQQPAACIVRAKREPDNWKWRNGSPRTAAYCNDKYCIYDNLWFNNGRFYLLVDGEAGVEPWKLTRNQDLNIMHVHNASEFLRSARHHVLGGDTLVFDFVFFLHPTAIGHWSEMLFPLFSILRQEPSFARPPTQFLQLHLKRSHMMEWVRAVLATALGVGPRQHLPPIMWQQEVGAVWDQISAPLEGYGPEDWLAFDRVMVVKDVYNGGVRTFLDTRDAHLFRKMLYAQYSLPPPTLRQPLPRTITFQRKRANRRVVNEDALLGMLREFGEVRLVEFNASTPFRHQLETMASTTVLVSVHTSNLANAQFMQPGSAVFEIIQRNWFWHGLDRSFQVQTAMMGDIHHYAWRATKANETVYIVERDRDRFGDWEPLQCNTEECVEAHTNVDVRVDIPAFRALLADRLPLVFAGWPVEAAAVPWPVQEGAEDGTA